MPPSSCHGGNASHARPRDEWWERATRATHRGVRLFILIWRLVLRQVDASSHEGAGEDRGRKPWAAAELRLGGHRDRGEGEHRNDEAPHRVKTTLCAMDFLNKSPFDCMIAIHPLAVACNQGLRRELRLHRALTTTPRHQASPNLPQFFTRNTAA